MLKRSCKFYFNVSGQFLIYFSLNSPSEPSNTETIYLHEIKTICSVSRSTLYSDAILSFVISYIAPIIFNVTLHTVQIIKPDRRCVKDVSRYISG